MVGADVPGGPRSPKAFPKVSPWARRAGDVAPYQGRGQDVGMVGADVPGGPRAQWRHRWRPRARGAPGTSRPTRGAGRTWAW